MVMTTTDISALVSGAPAMAKSAETILVYVQRSFLYRGVPVPAGTTVELPAPIARELVAMNKAIVAPGRAVADVDVRATVEVEAPRRRGRPPKQGAT